MGFAAMFAAALVLSAAAPAYAENTQQDKMTSCNAEAKAKGLSGADRKTFMKGCLSKEGAAPEKKLNSQQEKMKTCNADATAKGL
ncbi:MAG TPA: PsiF family protein, partial [Steroidobacteraceae bacterium]|nr:PsiF family protein [Steroidobacteraceae bacterium]